jgi:2-keto-4-pentenoate hydratase/2-oxohepta-3-ene-1,7-dioic acid hydratase in catechol pathway
LLKNGEIVQESNANKMIFNIDQIISYVSNYMTLKTGDLIFTGTPSGVGPIKIGDCLEGFINDKSMFKVNIK